ncbi:glycoside-pentoside-hexuronide (GPH):cation symporter [Levilactobacillus enshiensis]|uniref:glycoside-pentoside-hexuronide (GPH):cation symporter n=1 Tax=Levilactobacillus enshiensis TaxID=2590213 RepID=UPI00117B33F8|nr:glycoside-pentoside-hexuronide (GPH):cation symporter [Levilactobacillus enshiensis]
MENTNQPAAVKQHLTGRQWIERISFSFGNLGHSAFYGALSTYFIIYVTSGMFAGLPKAIASKLIGLITGLVVIIRLAEVVIDPILGNIVDNTNTRWGKFKPWQVIGGVTSSVLLVILFTGIFGLAKVNWVLFAVVFVILFVALDIFYSLCDVSYWGMVPAISEDSKERGVFTALGSFTGSIGWNGLTMIVVPVTTFFTFIATGKHEQGPQGWLAFAIIIAIVAILSALAVVFGTTEKQNVIRDAAKEKTSIKDVFLGIIHNDQILWTSLAYLMYSIAYVSTNGVLYYLFKFVIGRPNEFWIAGLVATIIGFCTAPLYPIFNKFIPRKMLFTIGQVSMILSYILLITARTNLIMVIIGLVLFNFTFAQLVTVLTLTDSIEYGQLKNGNRNEAVTLTIRPMIDKISGALSNGIVGSIALVAGMTGSATAKDMTSTNIHTFELFAFYAPMACAILALLIFSFKVKITEKMHAEIVDELQAKLAKGDIAVAPEDTTPVATDAATTILAPVDGELEDLMAIPDELNGFPGKGFAIKPTDNHLFAPYDGTVKFTFSTRHALGIVSDSGVEMIIHVGIDTVNLRGEGFVTHYEDGQKIKANDLLMTFDLDRIHQANLDDTVVVFFTQPARVQNMTTLTSGSIRHGQAVTDVTLTAKK